MSEAIVVLCTCPDSSVARKLAGSLVGAGLAACVNVLPEIRSIYRWRGEVHDEAEVLMIAKTTRERYDDFERCLLDEHPYDVPEVLALPVTMGSAPYLAWLEEQTRFG
jgi:periplasmic divalent cation tolerance protein